MTCLYCGFERHISGAKFCVRCGKPLASFCPHCGAQTPMGTPRCAQCGSPLAALGEQVAPVTEVADKPPTSGETLPEPEAQTHHGEGPARSERRVVTILFADISGFTALSERLDAEDVTRVMNGAFRSLSRCIQRYEGTIDKFIGDCVMVLFGAPVSHEDDPRRSILCALEMEKEIREYGKSAGHDLGLSIGINTGEVLAGMVGSDERKDYTVMGDTVNLAQRLQAQAGRDAILIGQETHRLAGRGFVLEELPAFSAKGKKELIKCYKVLGKEAVGEGRRRPRRVFAGRERELQALLDCYGEFAGRNPRIVAVVGDAGLGKNNLKDEFLSRLPADAPPVLEIECSSFLVESPYGVLRETLKKILKLGTTVAPVDVERSVEDLASVGLGDTQRQLLHSMLTGDEEKGPPRFLDPKARKDEIFRAFMGLFGVLWRKSPHIVVLVDLHWCDALSKELLTLIFHRMTGFPVLVLATFRPQFGHTWANLSHYRQINLGPLTEEGTIALARAELSDAPVSPELGMYLHQQSGGIPLFLRELVHILKETNLLAHDAGIVTLRGDIRQLNLPTGIRSVIGARVDRLPREAREILNTAAVLGRTFSLDLLDHLLPAPAQRALIEELVDEDILAQASETLDAYTFKHILIQEVIYQRIPKEDLARMHEEVAACLETMHFFSLDEHLETLARHYTRAGISDKAVSYWEQAGDKVARNFANEDAMRFYERAMEMLPGADGDSGEILARLQFKLGKLLMTVGQWEEAEKLLETASQSVETLSVAEPPGPAIRLELAKVLRKRGKIDRAMRECETILTQPADKELILEALRCVASVWIQRGEFLTALASLTRDLGLVRSFDDTGLAAKYLNDLGIAHFKVGHWDQAMESWKESLALKEELGDRKAVEVTLGNLGEACKAKGDFAGAGQYYTKSLRLAREMGDREGVAVNIHNLGVLRVEESAHEEAEAKFRESLKIAEEIDWAEGRVMNRLYLGRLKIADGRSDEGYPELEKSLEEARRLELTEVVGIGLYFLGEYHLKAGRRGEAKKYFDEAIDHARAMGHVPLYNKLETISAEWKDQ